MDTKAVQTRNRYRDLGKDILDIHAWPKEETQCSYWKGCEYMSLCSHPVNWRLYLRFYQQREMLYEEEKRELKT